MMQSIYQLALGDPFKQLHPQLQKKFGLHSQSGFKIVSKGQMQRIWGGQFFMSPFFRWSAKQHITFPERGENIPFTLENAAYMDPYGRESVAWIRHFYFPNVTRHFDATMVYSSEHNKILDYVGTEQSWVTEINMTVLANGGIRMTTSDQKLYLPLLRRFVSVSFLGRGIIEECYDDTLNQFIIKVNIQHPVFGLILAYEGHFTADYVPTTDEQLPSYLFPNRYRTEESAYETTS